MVPDLPEGRLPAAVTAATSFLQHHRGGALKLIMTSGPKRLRAAPDVPTARQLGVTALEMEEWYGFFASSATPAPVIEEWNRQLYGVLSDNEVVAERAQLGLNAAPSSPDEHTIRLASDPRRSETRAQRGR